jgi:uncharacterized phage protein (predicted DNA packaging)
VILDLEETKNFLRVDFTDDDTFITMLISVADEYLKNATGIQFDSTNTLAKLYCMCLISDWYENRNFSTDIRTLTVNEKVKYTLQSILLQLQFSYPTEV